MAVSDIRSKFSKTALVNVGLFALAAFIGSAAVAFAALPAGAALTASVAAGIGFGAARAAAGVIAAYFGGSVFPGQGEPPA